MRNLNFAALLNIIQKQVKNAYINPESEKKGVSQQETVYLLYEMILGEESSDLYVSSGNATKLFHQKANVSGKVIDRANAIQSLREEDIVEQRVQQRILNCLKENEKQQLWQELQIWLQESEPVTTQFSLNNAIGQPYQEKKLRILLRSCIILCSILQNKGESRDRKVHARQLPPMYRAGTGKRYDPHTMPGQKANKATLEFHIIQEKSNVLLYGQELVLEYILNHGLLIRKIECTSCAIEIFCDKLPPRLSMRRLKPEEFSQVREGIRSHPEEVKVKKTWSEPLCDMVYHWLERGETVGYGYFLDDKELVSFLDYRIRADRNIELDTQITRKDYRGKGITTGLIHFYRLKFMFSRLFLGTYEENVKLIALLKRCGFIPHMFYDEELGKSTDKVRDRLGPGNSDDPEKMTNSIYFYANSLLDTVYERFLENN